MSISWPLPDHPELLVLESTGYREYRVSRKKIAQQGTFMSKCMDNLIFPIILTCLLQKASWRITYFAWAVYVIYLIRSKLLALQYESVILLPPHGIQLEIHRGISRNWSLNIKRRFIPAINLTDVIIHEGLYGWNVLYYLAMVAEDPMNGCKLHVAFKELLPCQPILLQVYEGLHEMILTKSLNDKDTQDQLN